MKTIMIGEGWVTHSRPSKPKTSFNYAIFNLLIPINSTTPLLLNKAWSQFSNLNLSTSDYLDGKKGNISDLINKFLDQNLNYKPDEIWLQTLPRMWGYGFNPVSFWICYKNSKVDAVLCEVNNTFGDRHFYFIDNLQNKEKSTTILKKVFHVSPFFPISGKYEFKFAIDDKVSDISIDLLDDGGELSLKTRIHLNLSPLESKTKWQLIKKYGWFSFMVIYRIHWQALRLWKNKVPFYRRPVPPKEKITI